MRTLNVEEPGFGLFYYSDNNFFDFAREEHFFIFILGGLRQIVSEEQPNKLDCVPIAPIEGCPGNKRASV